MVDYDGHLTFNHLKQRDSHPPYPENPACKSSLKSFFMNFEDPVFRQIHIDQLCVIIERRRFKLLDERWNEDNEDILN